MNHLFVEALPSGITVASGGTRTAIKLDRPWQTEIRVDRTACPFETQEQREIACLEQHGRWRVLDNLNTPFSYHRLIIPDTCWLPVELRSLGGQEKISAVLRIVRNTISSEKGEFWLGVHIGASAAQNIGHLHYHLLRPITSAKSSLSDEETVAYCKSSSLIIFEEHGFRTVVGGCRAGQCFFVPEVGFPRLDDLTSDKLADILSRTVALYGERFRSKQGLPPDYMIGIKLSGDKIIYGYYIPILNHWGFTEYFGLLERTPLILPWPHEETLRHLLA